MQKCVFDASLIFVQSEADTLRHDWSVLAATFHFLTEKAIDNIPKWQKHDKGSTTLDYGTSIEEEALTTGANADSRCKPDLDSRIIAAEAALQHIMEIQDEIALIIQSVRLMMPTIFSKPVSNNRS